jgi:hypothetical protein
MVISTPITEVAVDAITSGVFAKPDPLVVEAYSAPDQEPLKFTSHESLSRYVNLQISQPRGLAFVFVVYPDMGGRPVLETIHLDPQHCPGQKLRYTWNGWGLISIQLYGRDQYRMSRIAANSAARANAWRTTYPAWTAPDLWNWRAVESHTRRLQRILKKVT